MTLKLRFLTQRTLTVASAITLCGALSSSGQNARPVDIAIVDAMVFDGTGAAPSARTVLIQNGRITAVGAHLAVPAGYTTIDATGEALLPGFFDLHTHWTESGMPHSVPVMANEDLAAGVTTVDDFNSSPESFEARRAWIGMLNAPHVNICGRISTPGGHGADWADSATTRQIVTPLEARAAVDDLMRYKPDCFGETMIDGWRYGMSPDNTSMNADAIAALVDEAHKFQMPVLTHTVTVSKGKDAGDGHVDVIAHALQDRDLDEATIAAIKRGGSAFAPTLAVYEPNKPGSTPIPATDPRFLQSQKRWHLALNNTRLLYEAGVPITLGTDAGMPGTPHGKSSLREMELLVQAGLPASAALIAGTANSARAMGEINDRGTIEVGKRADLVLLKGKPWETIGDVEKTDRVFLSGRLVFGPGALAPNPDVPMAAAKVGNIVDDFEREDMRTNFATLVVTNPDGGLSRSSEILQIVPREGTNHALLMTGKMVVKDKPSVSIVVPLTKGSIAPADLRGYKGIRLDIRGDGEYELRLNALNAAYSATVSGNAEWKSVEIPFTELHPIAGRRTSPADALWKGDDLTEIEVVAHRKGGTTTWVELDNILFF
ncbi:CIA30 family protein [Terriglobus roseus]|uniref:Imidazolonepropionase n=1 Tax=Terriglobus roseus TaxID=392734 RepID=A0A1H4KB45_9BACT|nr:amidohydrolase family protein [Terriglobus roseus]SEB55653.1 Imidazolonepropionase [Terriglobus roseus]